MDLSCNCNYSRYIFGYIMHMKHATTETLTKLVQDCVLAKKDFILANLDRTGRSPRATSAKSTMARNSPTDVWVHPRVLDLGGQKYPSGMVEIAHLGSIMSTVETWSNGVQDLHIFSDERQVVVIDLCENNDDWDEFGGLTVEKKRSILIEQGCIPLMANFRNLSKGVPRNLRRPEVWTKIVQNYKESKKEIK